MPTGVMLRWNDDKGFGFIKPDDDDGPDLFAHVSQLLDGEGSVRDGDAVRFKMEYDDRKGKDRATNVEVLEGGRGPRSRGRSRSRSPRRSPPRRGGGGGGGYGGQESRPGDWDCPACGVMVFASKSECFKCGEPKGGGGGRGGGSRSGGRDRSFDRRGGGGRDRSYDRRDRSCDRRDRSYDRRDGRRDRSYSR
ncbi:unnamed protein product [Polarella glacialis]|uniref:RanBP2-type domain-containing protein n=1 Tax=Polarella glacialis TaxID=89957 RepID=A0A813FWG2_POLGL|nr:unnamed protein product [Polarella glacialis]|mmetsp:Transcript_38442/g.69708  ORF Transcript_38442/g.69708 Transcript_38442/m.69708 type:complete len:193 (+) Transcript_38442:109-687(+)